jgi:hypothetical protein
MGSKQSKINPEVFPKEVILANKLAGLLKGIPANFTETEFEVIGYKPNNVVMLHCEKNEVVWNYIYKLKERQELLESIPKVIREIYFQPVKPPKKLEWYEKYIKSPEEMLNLEEYDFIKGHFHISVLVDSLPKLPIEKVKELESRLSYYHWKEWLIVKSFLQEN